MRTAGPFTSLKPGLARGLRDSRGKRSLGKTPQRAKANEEASQLPAGKRVVPEQAQALINADGPLPAVIAQLRVFRIRVLVQKIKKQLCQRDDPLAELLTVHLLF
ncbi:hypothetical protein N780_02380 [Pontibacillus chungwhensis BH030062]|uniref:Uncharacterized protein n=1 Tax=Pontibacillus chungwhensis BH030062 TaxID=1385513 RepID=A0A0A2UWQ9_9BACI|nr:hypothetical protein N780_02380 [Pontibacillus chungwhensis BH030062]